MRDCEPDGGGARYLPTRIGDFDFRSGDREDGRQLFSGTAPAIASRARHASPLKRQQE
jgi:hypothetical protein